MKRPLLTWLVFAACALTGLGVLGWFSAEMLRLERGAAQAREIAAREENVRLALWRMDSALASIHGLESARPVDDYEPFIRATTTYSVDLRQNAADGILLPSPLLGFTPPFVRLHLQVRQDGTITSPQAPEGPARIAALQADVPVDVIDSAATRLSAFRTTAGARDLIASTGPSALQFASERDATRRDDAQSAATREREQASIASSPLPGTAAPLAANAPPAPVAQLSPQAEQQATVELKKSQIEQQQRNVLADDNYYVGNRQMLPRSRSLVRDEAREGATGDFEVAREGLEDASASSLRGPAVAVPAERTGGTYVDAPKSLDSRGGEHAPEPQVDARTAAPAPLAAVVAEAAGMQKGKLEEASRTATPAAFESTPVAGALAVRWIGDELFLVRPITGSSLVRAQAVWLDWPELRAWLLTRITDLLPDAALEPADAASAYTLDDASRRLAFLPVRLQPGALALPAASSWSPLQISLAIAWALAGVGVSALALLLAGTLRLSERRGAFVSAVTHELRTPLTTFRMYTEMLASGMVPDEGKRRGYLDTLRKEAERLSHLVENVLSYARLERGRASRRIEDTTPADLFASIEERLRLRAEQGGLALAITFEPGAGRLALRTDTTAFEQIVFNVVDNAAKYARRPQGGGTLAITVAAGLRGRVIVRVADDGPGIAASVRKRLFQPFSKSAAEAAQSQPGVGLGLALSRRLARDELHGELALERTGPEGTVFRLEV